MFPVPYGGEKYSPYPKVMIKTPSTVKELKMSPGTLMKYIKRIKMLRYLKGVKETTSILRE